MRKAVTHVDKAVFAAFLLFLSGCITTQQPHTQGTSKEASLPTLKNEAYISCTHTALCQSLGNNLPQNSDFILAQAPSALNVRISTEINPINILQKRPAFFGKLQKRDYSAELITTYSVKSHTGEILSLGKVHAQTETQARIAPQTSAQAAHIPEQTWQKVASQLAPAISDAVRSAPWHTFVTGHAPDKAHFSVQASEHSGLRVTHHLIEADTPSPSVYQVVSFERDSTNTLRAILKTPQGTFPPKLGSKLTLTPAP